MVLVVGSIVRKFPTDHDINWRKTKDLQHGFYKVCSNLDDHFDIGAGHGAVLLDELRMTTIFIMASMTMKTLKINMKKLNVLYMMILTQATV